MTSVGSARPVSEAAPARGVFSDPLRLSTAAFAVLAIVVLGLGAFVAVVLPYGEWDALSFGIWSRLIAAHAPHLRFAGAIAADYHRPLFYVLQGWLWAVFGFHQWLGRLLSFAFSCVLVAATAFVAARAVRVHRRFAAALAVLVVLVMQPFERYVAAGLSDIPAAAMVALTAAVLLAGRLGRARLPLVAVAACLSVLAKPSSLPALAGLAAALLLGDRAGLRRRLVALGALAAGVVVGLVYDELQARYVHMGLKSFLLSGADSPFYRQLADTRRRSTLLDGAWLGNDLRFVLFFGVLYALARLGLSHRRALVVSLPAAVLWSWLGPHLAGDAGVFYGGASLEQIAVLVLALACLLAFAAPADAVPRRLDLARALVWCAPAFASWALYGVYDIRLLAPAWPALALLVVLALAPAFGGALEWRRWIVLAPAAALVVLGAYAIYGINGLGTSGWQTLRHGGISALGDPAQMRNLALGGDFAAEVDALAPEIHPSDRVITYDSRLEFLYMGQVDIAAPTSCGALAGHRIFVLLEDDELRTLYGKYATSAFWQSCTKPTLTKIAERPGAFAIFVSGAPTQAVGDCGASPPSGLAIQFGPTYRTQAAAAASAAHVVASGFVEAKVLQLGCAAYAVVEPNIPSASVGRGIVAEAKTASLPARLLDDGR